MADFTFSYVIEISCCSVSPSVVSIFIYKDVFTKKCAKSGHWKNGRNTFFDIKFQKVDDLL